MTSTRRCRFSSRSRSRSPARSARSSDPRADSDQADAVRHRHRRTDRRVSSSRCRRCSSASRCRTSCRVPAGLRRASSSASRCSSSWRRGCSGARSPDGYSLNMHPMAFAAWFGLLATALNLFPIGQLDGGHISYAVLGRAIDLRHAAARSCVAMVLAFFDSSWIVWTGLMIVMLLHVRAAPSEGVRRARAARSHPPRSWRCSRS